MALKLNINGYLIAFACCVYTLLAVLVFYHIDKRHHQQSGILVDLLEALIDGDYSYRGNDLYSPHFQSMLKRVNRLSQTLQQQSVALEEKQHLIQQVINHMDAAVLAIDEQQQLVFSNRAASRLFDLNRPLSHQLLSLIAQSKSGSSISLPSDCCALMHPGGDFLFHREGFFANAKQNQLLVFSELGQILHLNEAAAWQRLVRVFSHEINNAMAPIGTISRTMLRQAQTLQLPAHFGDGLKVIEQSCADMTEFIANYSRITQLPQPQRQPVLLSSLFEGLEQSMVNCTLTIELPKDVEILVDGGQIRQVLLNLLKNALDAMAESKETAGNIDLIASVEDNEVLIHIIDSGKGITNPDNLFVPFYTTKSHGSGIGLMLCAQIISNHFGRLSLTNRTDGKGAVATIRLPL